LYGQLGHPQQGVISEEKYWVLERTLLKLGHPQQGVISEEKYWVLERTLL
jgi:hypothetical protein